LIVARADAQQPNMALTSWKGAVVRKQDIYTAKNYLNADELDSLNRFVTVFLETAELRAKNRQDITMDFWRDNVDRIIAFNDKTVLNHKGAVSHAQMENRVESLYEQFDTQRKTLAAAQADAEDLNELVQLSASLKSRAPKSSQ
jgi:Virulence protein